MKNHAATAPVLSQASPEQPSSSPLAGESAAQAANLSARGGGSVSSARLAELHKPRSREMERVYEDYCKRWEAGEVIDKEQYCAQFPHLQSSLRELLSLHDVVNVALDKHSQSLARKKVAAGPPPAWPASGSPFLQFQLLRELGRGAFSRVFLATEAALGNRQVAVKITFRGGKEAQTLGRLEHANIVPVHSVAQDPVSGLSAVCMPYRGSATLGTVLDRAVSRGGLPVRAQAILDAASDTVLPEEAEEKSAPDPVLQKGSYADGIAHLGTRLADALAFIHARGVYHRDLKPSNVLLTPQGTPMLLDFNLAQDAPQGIYQLGGTLPYMSPEQLHATAPSGFEGWQALDARSDLFSLGVILYELLGGRHPFDSALAKLPEEEARCRLLERQQRGPLPLRQLNPQVDRSLAQIVERCLAFDPARRFSSAAALAAALRRRNTQRADRLRSVLRVWGIGLLFLASGALFVAAREPANRLKQGWEAYRRGEYRQAAQCFGDAIDADKKDPERYFARGRARQQLAQFAAALADYQTADNLKPQGKFKAAIGYCQSRLRNHAEAIAWYDAALKEKFAPAELHNALGFSFLKQGQLDQAQRCFEEAIRLNPALQIAYTNRADLDKRRALRNKSYYPEQGLKDIKKALELGPPAAELHFVAAPLHALAAEKKQAAQALPALVKAEVSLALEQVRYAIENELDLRPWEHDPAFRALHGNRRFQELMRTRPVVTRALQEFYGLADPIQDITKRGH